MTAEQKAGNDQLRLEEPATWRYSAFISYSHGDTKWAKWLHDRLETYVVQPSLRDASVVNPQTGRLRPVFRDRDELPGSASLAHSIVAALNDSAFLIVICSPRSAKSTYVNHEIEHFRSTGRAENILAIIIEGEPGAVSNGDSDSECFPPAMRSTDAAGAEPLAADLRPQGDGKQLAVLKIVAAILETNLGEIRRRDVIRRRRQLVRRAAIGCLSAFLFLVAYVAASDAGFDIPVSESIRWSIDRNEMSLLRPVPKEGDVKQAASELRRQYIEILSNSRLNEGRFPWDVGGEEDHADTWSTCQALAALCRSPETTEDQSDRLMASFRRMFTPEVLLYKNDVPDGWQQRKGSPTRGPVALWLTTAVALAIERNDLFDQDQREELMQLLTTATKISNQYHSTIEGGWNMFGGAHVPYPDNYTSVLALQTLLHLQRADLPWVESSQLRRQLLQDTAYWLVSSYDRTLPVPGWRRAKFDERSRVGFDGMTIQIYSLLLKAESMDAVELPTDLIENAIAHLEQCVDREYSYAITTAEFNARVIYEGEEREEHEAVGFLWHPWAIEACEGLLRRHEKAPLAPEHLTRIRRSYGHLVTIAGDRNLLNDERLFATAEMLYGLASVPR